MQIRPTRPASSIRLHPTRRAAGVITALMFLASSPVAAIEWPQMPDLPDWEGTTAQRVVLTGMDVTIVRPLAAARAGIGAILLVPAALIASPGCVVNLVTGADCRSIYEAPYEVLVGEPSEYAFERELGEL